MLYPGLTKGTIGKFTEHSAPQVKALLQSLLETEAYPTDARMKQKEREKKIKDETGEKHKPKKRSKIIQPGNDDCGEDFTPLLESTGTAGTFTIFDHCTTDVQRAELHMELDSRTELLLYATELNIDAELFHGSDISPRLGRELPNLPSITEAMVYLSKQSPGRYHDIVEICGGEARTSKILISRRPTMSVRTST